jgi:hypothetical protein
MKYVVGFAQFWYDFIVGDDVTLAVGGVGVLILGALLVRGGYQGAAEAALPLTVLATIIVSTGALKR